MFSIITAINESKILTKDNVIKGRFDGKKCNSDEWWNNEKCQCECKNCHVSEKDFIWNAVVCSCENRKHAKL